MATNPHDTISNIYPNFRVNFTMNTVEQAHYFGSSGFYGTVTAVFRCLVGGGAYCFKCLLLFLFAEQIRTRRMMRTQRVSITGKWKMQTEL